MYFGVIMAVVIASIYSLIAYNSGQNMILKMRIKLWNTNVSIAINQYHRII